MLLFLKILAGDLELKNNLHLTGSKMKIVAIKYRANMLIFFNAKILYIM